MKFKIIRESDLAQNTYVKLTKEQLIIIRNIALAHNISMSTVIRQMVAFSLENMDEY